MELTLANGFAENDIVSAANDPKAGWTVEHYDALTNTVLPDERRFINAGGKPTLTRTTGATDSIQNSGTATVAEAQPETLAQWGSRTGVPVKQHESGSKYVVFPTAEARFSDTRPISSISSSS